MLKYFDTGVAEKVIAMESPPLAPPCALAEPCLVGEQNALGFGVWARRADLMRVLRPQISTPRLVVKPCPQKVCKARIPPLCPALPTTLACDWTSLLVSTLTICRAVCGAQDSSSKVEAEAAN